MAPKKSVSILVDVAMGRKPADMVIRNGTWVCVQSGEYIPETDIAIIDGTIAYVGPDASHTIGRKTKQINAQGKYLVPGLLDGHMHVESNMMTITEFVRAALPRGTTGIFADPHEMANVFGLKGIKQMVREASRQPIHVWMQVPSCVPSAKGFETAGAEIGSKEVARALTWPGIIGLGEVMDYPGVTGGDEKMQKELDAAKKTGKVIGGHYPSTDLGRMFHAYAAGGAEDDHEGTRVEDAVARIRQGMKAMLRLGSAWQDVAEGIKAITELHLDSRHFILCTDDAHAGTLVNEGHMDRVIRYAIAHGLPAMTAIQMATINTAEHFGLSREIGVIAPGRRADIVIVPDIASFQPEMVIAGGRVAAEKGKIHIKLPRQKYPGWTKKSMHIQREFSPDDFRLSVMNPDGNDSRKFRAHVIGIIENQAPTHHLVFEMTAEGGQIRPDIGRDIAKVAVIERHHGSGAVQVGLVNGFGFAHPCAIASTVAHDSHQLIIVGTSESDMALAANTLIRVGGGQVVIKEGKEIGLIELAIGGLMSVEEVHEVAKKAETILAGFRSCGCNLNNPNMQLTLLSLVVIPELRLSDKGLLDVTRFTFIPVIEEHTG